MSDNSHVVRAIMVLVQISKIEGFDCAQAVPNSHADEMFQFPARGGRRVT
jgi:hypothetical protein